MLTVLLTGGIATGKSTITKYFLEHHICCIDADLIAREQLDALKPQLAKWLGQKIILPDGSLDRAVIRQLIFSDNRKRLKLEKWLHPLIYREMQRRAQVVKSPYLVYIVPLFTPETCPFTYTRILKVTCDPALQLKRLYNRYPHQKALIPRVLRHQTAPSITNADDLIYNDGNIKSLNNTLDTLHRLYLKLAKSSILL